MKSFLFQYKRLITVLVFLGVLLLVFQLSGMRDHFSLALLQQRIMENRIDGLLIFILLFSVGNLVQIPGWLFLAAAVLTLGEVMGGFATYIAACISCAVTFVTIRYVGGNALRQLNGNFANKIFNKLDSAPITSILLLRVLFQTVPALNYALAMSGVSFRNYMIGTLLGLPLPIFVYCVFFDYLARTLKLL